MPQRPIRLLASCNDVLAGPALAAAARFKRQLLAGACLALLAACGGGGGSAGSAADVEPGAPQTPSVTPGTPPTVTPTIPPTLTPTVTPTVTPPPPVTPVPPPAAPLVAPGTWVVMGSSTASGAGATSQSWADRLRAAYAARSVTVVNIAKGGTTTYAALPASSPPVSGRPAPDPSANVDAALARSPKLVLVAYPSNDTASGFSVDETVRNLLAVRSAAQAGGAAVIILSTQPLTLPPAQLALLPQIDARVSAAVAPCFVPVREALAAPDGTLSPTYDSGDHLHPNDAGHAVIFSKLASVIDSGQCVRTQ